MGANIIDRPIKLDINSNDSDLLKTIKKALKGFTTIKLRNLFMDNEEDKFHDVLKSIENSDAESKYYLMLLERIDLASNAKSILDEFNINRRYYMDTEEIVRFKHNKVSIIVFHDKNNNDYGYGIQIAGTTSNYKTIEKGIETEVEAVEKAEIYFNDNFR